MSNDFRLSLSLCLIAFLMISISGNYTILQQANAITFDVDNLGLPADKFEINENIIKFTVSEEHHKIDLNNDGDTDDKVSHIYNHLDETITNLELADSGHFRFTVINDNLVALLINERDQGNTDLNGDGDAKDFNVIHIYDPSTNTITNLGLSLENISIIGNGALYGNLIIFEVDEISQGNTDLNGDGDAKDFNVIHIYDHSTGVITNLELAGNISDVDGNLVTFSVSEDFQGRTDLNGDGDKRDSTPHIYDHSTGTVTNLELSGYDAKVDGNLVTFFVSELAQGKTDLNGDGDNSNNHDEDQILHVYDHSTGIITNLKIAGWADLIIDNNLVIFSVYELTQGKTDLNGNGVIGDTVLHIYDHSTGVITNSGVEGLLDVDGNLMSLVVPEDFLVKVDLNGDGDTEDYVVHVYDQSTGTTINLGLASLHPKLDGNLVVVWISENEQGNTDLNGDGDTEDNILYVYDHSTKETVNLEIGGFPTLDGNLIAFASDEFSQGNTDLNGDGDTRDRVLHIYDHSTETTNNLEISVGSFPNPAIDGNLVVFTVDEFSQGNTDLNGDGDTNDSVLHVMELIEDKVIEDELFCGKDVSEFDSVIEGTDGDDILQGTKDNDLILGMNGDDLIYASSGNDCIYGGNDNDFIFGRGGNDTIFGENGNDTLFGAMGNDVLNGGLGNDHLVDDNGDDILDGGEDDDLCFDKYGNNEFIQCETRFN